MDKRFQIIPSFENKVRLGNSIAARADSMSPQTLYLPILEPGKILTISFRFVCKNDRIWMSFLVEKPALIETEEFVKVKIIDCHAEGKSEGFEKELSLEFLMAGSLCQIIGSCEMDPLEGQGTGNKKNNFIVPGWCLELINIENKYAWTFPERIGFWLIH